MFTVKDKNIKKLENLLGISVDMSALVICSSGPSSGATATDTTDTATCDATAPTSLVPDSSFKEGRRFAGKKEL